MSCRKTLPGGKGFVGGSQTVGFVIEILRLISCQFVPADVPSVNMTFIIG